MEKALQSVSFAVGLIGCALLSSTMTTPAFAVDPIRIGFVATMSGPEGVLGRDVSDGFKLALKETNTRLGGRPVQMVWGDDQAKPDIGRQIVDKMLESDHVQIVTGIHFSNVLLGVVKPVLDSGAFFISAYSGPSALAGKQCHPRFFSAAFHNDANYEGMGQFLQDKGIKNLYLMSANYPAGKDMMAGTKRYYKGSIVSEVYTAFGQLDYSAEIAQIRAAKPDAVLVFYPGGMGINFLKQYAQAGLKDLIPIYAGNGVYDQTTLPAVGDAALGMQTGTLWSEYLDNPANKAFVAHFEAEYGRVPSGFAAMAYDTVRLMDAALTTIDGKVEDKKAFQTALENVKFESVRGDFKFNTNHYPIQGYYIVEIVKDAKGRLVGDYRSKVWSAHPDPYVGDCKMVEQ